MGDASERYSDKVLTLAYEPLNVGEMVDPHCIGRVKGECGDTMLIFLRFEENKISEATFLTDGCGATLACGSAVTELAKGKTLSEAESIDTLSLLRYLDDMPASHEHCLILAVKTLHKALKDLK